MVQKIHFHYSICCVASARVFRKLQTCKVKIACVSFLFADKVVPNHRLNHAFEHILRNFRGFKI